MLRLERRGQAFQTTHREIGVRLTQASRRIRSTLACRCSGRCSRMLRRLWIWQRCNTPSRPKTLRIGILRAGEAALTSSLQQLLGRPQKVRVAGQAPE
jgi:hypothetical protein